MNSIRFVLLMMGMICFSHWGYSSFDICGFNPDSLERRMVRDKVYLHLDRAHYSAGESVWFKTYLISRGSNKHVEKNEIVYVDVINPENEILITKILQIEQAVASGNFKIPLGTPNGIYEIRAYTNFMRNLGSSSFFKKSIRIGDTAKLFSEKTFIGDRPIPIVTDAILNIERPYFKSYPEGKSLVNGFVNRLGFRMAVSGRFGERITGKIVNASGKIMTTFISTHFGMGMFSFRPQKGEKYWAKIEHNENIFSYPLPDAEDFGTLMHVFDRGDHYQVEIKSSKLSGVNGLQLGIFQEGIKISTSEIDGNSQYAAVTLSKELVNNGIVQFTLFDRVGQPVCERLFFHRTDFEPVQIKSPKTQYGKKELVDLEISIGDDMKDFKGDMSLSVSRVSDAESELGSVDIRTYLLLTSELEEKVEKPSYYLNVNEQERRKNLDLLMMTQNWGSFMNRNVEEIRFPREKGITLKGRVVQTNSRDRAVSAKVSLTYKNKNEVGHDMVQTGSNGEFKFKNLHFVDSTSVFLLASSLSKRNKKSKGDLNANPSFFIIMDSLARPEVNSQEPLPLAFDRIIESTNVSPSERPDSKSFTIDETNLIRLKGTVVTDKKLGPEANMERKRQSSLYTRPSYSMDYEEIRKAPVGNAMTPLQGRVPGLQVLNNTIIVRGMLQKTPLYLLDGHPVPEETIFATPIADIDFVDYIKPGQAVIYGMDAFNGVIAVYTLDGREQFYEEKKPHENGVGTLSYTHPGLTRSENFFQWEDDIEEAHFEKVDHGRTLYWEPNVELGQDGKVNVSFYTSGHSGTYQATLQGISEEGTPIYSRIMFECE